MMKYWILIVATVISVESALANVENYYEKYPVGYIAENLVYDLFNLNRDKLRDCHLNYLQKIPGAFDGLSAEFLIDPHGNARPMKSEPVSESKDEAMNCLKAEVKNFSFPSPSYGIVFVRFESDVDATNMDSIKGQELARSAVSYMPYMPRRMISSVVEMYMPYYKGCFKEPYLSKVSTGQEFGMRWSIGEDGRATDIEIIAPEKNDKLNECLGKITEQHRYPSGFLKTAYEIKFPTK